MSKFNDFLNEQLQDPEVRAEYEALEPEFSIMQAMIDARKSSGMTQKQLSEKTGIAQADISKLESGSANPSLRTLQRLAAGMGMRIKIEFQPFTNAFVGFALSCDCIRGTAMICLILGTFGRFLRLYIQAYERRRIHEANECYVIGDAFLAACWLLGRWD